MSAPGSIRKAYEACCAATGKRAHTARVGTLIPCPLHNDRTASFSLRESTETFNCFGACGQKGGVFALVVAFGLAQNHSEASAWLAERGIIPPAIGAGKIRPAYVLAATYTDHSQLTNEQSSLRIESLLALEDAIGPVRLRMGRDFIAILRHQRQAPERARWAAFKQFVHSQPEITNAVAAVLCHPQGFDPDVRAQIWAEMLPPELSVRAIGKQA